MLDSLPSSPIPESLRAVAFLLPQFHPVAENDAFWGTGFTEWRNVARARPRFAGHDQPQLPADLGFYDLRLPQTRYAQAAMARAAGLSGFAWYHYWFAGRRVLHQPFDAVLADDDYDFPFLLCWANENWTRAWDGGAREVLIAQSYSDADTRAHARHLVPALLDPRAIRVGDRPVFAVYAADDLPDPLRWSDLFREELSRFGIDPYLMRVERHLDHDRRPPADLGFDAAIEFQPFSRNFLKWLKERPELSRALPARMLRRSMTSLRSIFPVDRHFDMAEFVRFDLGQALPDYPLCPGLCPSWDNTARRPPGKALIFRDASPDLFAQWTAGKAAQARDAGAPLLFVNAWNEWAEGNHLEPCLSHGHAWLDALSTGLARASVTCTRSAPAAAA